MRDRVLRWFKERRHKTEDGEGGGRKMKMERKINKV